MYFISGLYNHIIWLNLPKVDRPFFCIFPIDDRRFGYKQKSLEKKHCSPLHWGPLGFQRKQRAAVGEGGGEGGDRGGGDPRGRTVTQEADGSAGVHCGGREDMLTKLHTQSSFPFPCKLVSSVEKRQSPQQPRTGMSSWTERLLLYGRSCRAIVKV